MKITVEHNNVAENEIVLRCRELDDEMLHILSLLRSGMQSICAWTEDRQMVLLSPPRSAVRRIRGGTNLALL